MREKEKSLRGPKLFGGIRPEVKGTIRIRRSGQILSELQEHLPYTLFAALGGVGLLGFFSFFSDLTGRGRALPAASADLFHALHFTHLFLSAMATTAMFWRHDRRWLKTVFIGLVGTLLPCGASDIFFPFVGGTLIGVSMTVHVCLLEHPLLVWPFLLAGCAAGLVLPTHRRSTHFAHGGHVLVSTGASLLYLISFGVTDWLRLSPLVFLILVAAVLIPCCTSDIVFPLLLTHRACSDSHAVDRAV